MMISTRGRYALRVLIDLAEHQTDAYIPLKDIAQRQNLSEKYLESILKILVQNKLLSGLRGKGGGYRLSKSPEQITAGDVLRLTEASLAPVACLGPDSKHCERVTHCRTLSLWKNLDTLVNNYLDGVSIADLMDTPECGNDYII